MQSVHQRSETTYLKSSKPVAALLWPRLARWEGRRAKARAGRMDSKADWHVQRLSQIRLVAASKCSRPRSARDAHSFPRPEDHTQHAVCPRPRAPRPRPRALAIALVTRAPTKGLLQDEPHEGVARQQRPRRAVASAAAAAAGPRPPRGVHAGAGGGSRHAAAASAAEQRGAVLPYVLAHLRGRPARGIWCGVETQVAMPEHLDMLSSYDDESKADRHVASGMVWKREWAVQVSMQEQLDMLSTQPTCS